MEIVLKPETGKRDTISVKDLVIEACIEKGRSFSIISHFHPLLFLALSISYELFSTLIHAYKKMCIHEWAIWWLHSWFCYAEAVTTSTSSSAPTTSTPPSSGSSTPTLPSSSTAPYGMRHGNYRLNSCFIWTKPVIVIYSIWRIVVSYEVPKPNYSIHWMHDVWYFLFLLSAWIGETMAICCCEQLSILKMLWISTLWSRDMFNEHFIGKNVWWFPTMNWYLRQVKGLWDECKLK